LNKSKTKRRKVLPLYIKICQDVLAAQPPPDQAGVAKITALAEQVIVIK